MKNWELWIQRNKPALAHPTNLKEQFVRRVLSTIDDIGPEHLAPAHLFTDDKGNERYVDILITIPDKQQIAIELDGLAPYKTADGDIDYRQFNGYLEQQNALNAAYPALLRYGASKIEHAPDMIASEIRDTLRAQAEGSYLPKNKKEDNAAIVEAYQEDILALKKIWATEAIGLKEQADRLIAQAAGKGRNDAQLHAQMQLLDAEIRTYEEKIRQYQRASITTVIANEIDIKALIAEIQTLKDIMADLRQASVEDSQGGYERKSAAPWVLGIVAVLALGAAATGGYYYFAKVAGKKTPIPVEEDPPAVLTELPVIGQAVSNTGTSNTRPVVSSDVVPPTPVATTAEQQPQPETRTSDGSIMAREAGQYIGETRRVCGKVAALKETKKSIALHFDAPSPNQSFTAVVWKTSRALSRQASHLVHADICVTGKIEENRKKPQMIVSESAQISFND
nr:hypothetical protein [uncultured Cardiobacterium sp.]